MLRRVLVLPFVYGLMVLFVACAQAGTPGTATLEPTTAATATVAAAAEEATETAAAPDTATPEPATPTEAVTPAASDAPTEAASAAVTSTPVLEALETTSTTSTSPDGQWVAVAAVSFPTTKNGQACENCGDQYFARLTVRRADGRHAWTAIAEWRQMGLGYGTPAVFQWAADGTALYFTEVSTPDGCGLAFSNGSGLKRLDLTDGTVTELLPANGYWLTLAPDEGQVAYMAYGQRGLVVRDLETGAEQEYAVADLGGQAGAVVWAPDASAVALTVQQAAVPCGGGDGQHLVIRVNLADGARTVLVEPSAQRVLTTTEWPSADRLILADADGARWVLTLSTGQLAPEA